MNKHVGNKNANLMPFTWLNIIQKWHPEMFESVKWFLIWLCQICSGWIISTIGLWLSRPSIIWMGKTHHGQMEVWLDGSWLDRVKKNGVKKVFTNHRCCWSCLENGCHMWLGLHVNELTSTCPPKKMGWCTNLNLHKALIWTSPKVIYFKIRNIPVSCQLYLLCQEIKYVDIVITCVMITCENTETSVGISKNI